MTKVRARRPKRAAKTAISLPAETFERAERLRRVLGKSRSELYAMALDAYFGALEVRELESRYAAGYSAKPESVKEVEALTRASAEALPAEDW